MSNSQITSQLTRVTVPQIGDANFVSGIHDAFEIINNNFKNIASLPFIQGVQGDSYTLISKDIWVENGTYNYKLSKEGAVLLNSIFESALKDIRFNEGDSFEKCKKEKLGKLSLNGVSPIDSFFTEEIEDDKTVKKLVNNKLYFYSVINNLNEEQDTYLGQYFYFIDARITELGNVYGSESLSEFNDFTGFYQYQPANDTEPERYNVISIVPNLYYDKYKDDICWKYNGQETGISAIGPKGLDGKDSNFVIIFVSSTSETANSGNILGYYDFNANGGNGGIIYENTIKDCFCLIQFVSTTIENDKTVITEYVDSAFGEVHSNKAYWEDEYRISKLFNNQNITRYFCSMGASSSIENHPFYFAIPSYRDRTNSSITEYKYGHVLLSSERGDLVLQKSTNAFTANGQQEEVLTLANDESTFNIRNYNVNIGYTDGGNNFGGNLNVLGSASIGSLDVSGSASIGSIVDIGGRLSVSGDANIGGSGGLGVNWNANIGGDLNVLGSANIGSLYINDSGSLDVQGSASIGTLDVIGGLDASHLYVSNDGYISNLHVNGSASIGTLDIDSNGTITGSSFNVDLNDGTVSLKSGGYGIDFDDLGSMVIDTNDLTIEGGVSMTNSLGVTGGASISNGLTVTGGLDVTTKKPNNIDIENGTADGKSNVLFGHNNPGNSGLTDFPLEIENVGYPLVIKSTKSDGTTDPGYMVFGPGDIYAVKKDTVDGKEVIVPNKLCLQHRTDYYGDVLIGRDLEVGYYGHGGTGGKLIISGPNNVGGKALIIKKPSDDGKTLVDKLTIFSNGNIVTEGSAEIKKGATITGATYDTTSHTGLIVTGGIGGTYSGEPGGVGLIVRGGTVKENSSSSTVITSLGLKVETGGAEVSDNMSVGRQLIVNENGLNNASTSIIYGKNAKTGGTTNGGSGLIIYGGSGMDTNDSNNGKGGVGLLVHGGPAGDFTPSVGGTVSQAPYGGTGLVVYGGNSGKYIYDGSIYNNINHEGEAIRTYGSVTIGDIAGDYSTKISSNSDGLNINDKALITGSATINGIATIKGGAIIKNNLKTKSLSSDIIFKSHIFPGNNKTVRYELSGEYTTNVIQVDMDNSGGGCKVQFKLPTMTSADDGKILIIYGQAINTSGDKPDWEVEGIQKFSITDKTWYTLVIMYCDGLNPVGYGKWILLHLDARD